MSAACKGRADKQNEAKHGSNHRIFDGVLFLLPTVVILLTLMVLWTGNLPFCCVMQQVKGRCRVALLHSGSTHFSELILQGDVVLSRYYRGKFKSPVQDDAESMNKLIALLLLHVKQISMLLLQRIEFKIRQNKGKAFFY
jgi:hypothetical protein